MKSVALGDSGGSTLLAPTTEPMADISSIEI